ncbi:WUSCHEL related homeobox 1 [Striga asiatica]|uniref:WUSCHEL related homeobox 1 n=1 Tax=Striga asiatica TaxID=4170 RepID=A0A5A7Q1M8_STRAF|nr:WUSCHEL related homeobox 1 [Striga asiatica]
MRARGTTPVIEMPIHEDQRRPKSRRKELSKEDKGRKLTKESKQEQADIHIIMLPALRSLINGSSSWMISRHGVNPKSPPGYRGSKAANLVTLTLASGRPEPIDDVEIVFEAGKALFYSHCELELGSPKKELSVKAAAKVLLASFLSEKLMLVKKGIWSTWHKPKIPGLKANEMILVKPGIPESKGRCH